MMKTNTVYELRYYAVLITPPYIPAGMTGMRPDSAGMQINSTGIAIFQQESTGIGMNYFI